LFCLDDLIIIAGHQPDNNNDSERPTTGVASAVRHLHDDNVQFAIPQFSIFASHFRHGRFRKKDIIRPESTARLCFAERVQPSPRPISTKANKGRDIYIIKREERNHSYRNLELFCVENPSF